MHLRFAAMIATAMVVMYATMFVAFYEWGHIRWSESRAFMAMTMGGTMGLVMLGWMLNMYRSKAGNVVVAASLLLLLGAVCDAGPQPGQRGRRRLDERDDPHRSKAVTRSEPAQLSDVRACELAVEISEAQRREISRWRG